MTEKPYAIVICQEFLDRRKMTEWGSLSLVDEGEGDVAGKSISLPGVRSGDLSSRHWKPEVRVSCVQFSPTGYYEFVLMSYTTDYLSRDE